MKTTSRAAHAGKLLAVRTLFEFGCELSKKDVNGNTAAHYAAHEGHLWILHYLLEQQKEIMSKGGNNVLELEIDLERCDENNKPMNNVLGGPCHLKRSVLHYACDGGTPNHHHHSVERPTMQEHMTSRKNPNPHIVLHPDRSQHCDPIPPSPWRKSQHGR
jgi:hypothetical protein